MQVEKLSHFIELPETHRKILSGYEGPYSLGIGQAPGESDQEPILILQLQHLPAKPIPSVVRLDGEKVRVVVHTDFVQPSALGTFDATPAI